MVKMTYVEACEILEIESHEGGVDTETAKRAFKKMALKW